MYPVVAAAKSRCPAVMTGVARTRAESRGRSGGARSGRRRAYEFLLGRLTTREAREYLAQAEELEVVDEESAREQHRPSQPEHGPERLHAGGFLTLQTTGSEIGRHCHRSSASARVAAST